MTDPTPPFSALRALEAATRHRSFTWAARELKITHSAVSQAVRRLEAELGVRLFERRGTAMEPSDAARRLAASYSTAAQQLTDAIRDVTGEDPTARLVVALPAPIADLWLQGRLSRLAESLPDIEVVFRKAEAGSSDADLELVATPKPRAQDLTLTAVACAPVAAPERAQALTHPEDILAAPLLGDGSDAWRCWSARHAPGRQGRPKAFATADAMLQAAANGEGVAMADLLLIQPFLASGQLALSPLSAASGRSLVLRSRAGPAKADAVERLAMWLKLELARDAAQIRRATAVDRPGEPLRGRRAR